MLPRAAAEHPLTQQLQATVQAAPRAALAGAARLRGCRDLGPGERDLRDAARTGRLLRALERSIGRALAAFALGTGAAARSCALRQRTARAGTAVRPVQRCARRPRAHPARGAGRRRRCPGTARAAALDRRARRAGASASSSGPGRALALSANALPAGEQPALRALLVWAALARAHSQRAVAALPDTAHRRPSRPAGWLARLARRAPGRLRALRAARRLILGERPLIPRSIRAAIRGRPGELNGRVIAITGAGDGIGRAVALACAAHQAQVILIGRNVDKLEAVHAQIQAQRRAGGQRSRRWILRRPWRATTTSSPMRCRSATGDWTGCCTTPGCWARSPRSSTTTCRPGAASCT